MRIVFLLLIFSLKSQAQLQFWNTNLSSTIPLFEVEMGKKTIIHTKIGKETKPTFVFYKTAQQTFNRDGKTKYEMTVESSDNVAKRKFEISYTHYRQTNHYLGFIKITYNYHDKRPTTIFEENFNTITNP
ncbi:hypothetical protein M0M57_08120 [Flavobacterium azooxidireducens]|uniref:DUF3108 domain-containing protein n=1 Tax=Flavobacterium azooxidireducens TaxID=1871076 RepID=A0ABY4KJ05_9FLAO|nr:hypothetical protein [Flavobacterium azooxidireducens]UPQ80793.1 hypothetical protein M0M57_08120 [Flavobacterium azooxidireducens]